MAIKRTWNFVFEFIGDGSTTSIVRNLLDGTVSLTDPSTGALKSPAFPNSASLAGVTPSNGTISSSSVDVNGIATFTYSLAPTNGQPNTISGRVDFV